MLLRRMVISDLGTKEKLEKEDLRDAVGDSRNERAVLV